MEISSPRKARRVASQFPFSSKTENQFPETETTMTQRNIRSDPERAFSTSATASLPVPATTFLTTTTITSRPSTRLTSVSWTRPSTTWTASRPRPRWPPQSEVRFRRWCTWATEVTGTSRILPSRACALTCNTAPPGDSENLKIVFFCQKKAKYSLVCCRKRWNDNF